VIAAACSLELIHTYSLIHDDLPAMDNDDYRRGKPTNHKVFGDGIAVLAGDALLTLAFEVLARIDAEAERRTRLIVELAVSSGTVGGMIGGQVADLEGEGKRPDAQLLETIHRAKTGALLRASLRMGAIYAGATDQQYQALSCYGEHVGLAFQIVDDILDVEQSSEELGKTAGKDAAQHKITFPAVYGLEESRHMAQVECGRAHAVLEPFGGRAERLHELADLIVQRKS
jgi:geranylgeranyl diphosphate synthase type II